MIIPIILAGGSGTRLWPLSRNLYPKQLMSLVDGNTLLQNTVLRLMSMDDVSSPIVVCNEEHRFHVAEQLRDIQVKPLAIILEPIGKNTAPAVTVSAFKAMAEDESSILLVLPADHHLEDMESFIQTLNAGAGFAEKGYCVTFGIVPNAPETGYGYIQKSVPLVLDKTNPCNNTMEGFAIQRFVEKPDQSTAREYLQSGEYFWNSGMFMFQCRVILNEMKEFAPDIVASCREAVRGGRNDLEFFRLDSQAFHSCRSDSIDYAVMEKTNLGVVIPLNSTWNDLGSWEALWQVSPKDKEHNVFKGDVLAHEVSNSFIHSSKRLVAAVGIKDHVVVETSDAILVAHKDKVQDVRHIVSYLKATNREEAITHKKVYRPWGSYEGVDLSDRFQVKRIIVKPGAKLSAQKHYHRAEHWIVVSGTALVTKGEEELVIKEDESTYIPLGMVHRLENPGKIPLELIEVQSGSYLGEDDIVRFEDVYGRSD